MFGICVVTFLITFPFFLFLIFLLFFFVKSKFFLLFFSMNRLFIFIAVRLLSKYFNSFNQNLNCFIIY